ncbi:MAG: hypothetical protein ABFS02_11545 [Pseudomonadota bacterium]
MMYTLAAAELILSRGLVLGVAPCLTYSAVLLLHGEATSASYRQYLPSFDERNLLFFAAWPMLAACFALYYLRDLDTRWRIPMKSSQPRAPLT